MAPAESPLVSLLLLGLIALQARTCPATCRCYSMTVECGSLGLREIPASIHPATQVSLRQESSSHLGAPAPYGALPSPEAPASLLLRDRRAEGGTSSRRAPSACGTHSHWGCCCPSADGCKGKLGKCSADGCRLLPAQWHWGRVQLLRSVGGRGRCVRAQP